MSIIIMVFNRELHYTKRADCQNDVVYVKKLGEMHLMHFTRSNPELHYVRQSIVNLPSNSGTCVAAYRRRFRTSSRSRSASRRWLLLRLNSGLLPHSLALVEDLIRLTRFGGGEERAPLRHHDLPEATRGWREAPFKCNRDCFRDWSQSIQYL
jgi:hypothetical protein